MLHEITRFSSGFILKLGAILNKG